jgi:hypothetical protein
LHPRDHPARQGSSIGIDDVTNAAFLIIAHEQPINTARVAICFDL